MKKKKQNTTTTNKLTKKTMKKKIENLHPSLSGLSNNSMLT
jgi:hypothetical protein